MTPHSLEQRRSQIPPSDPTTKVTACSLTSLKSVRRLLALFVVHDVLMDTDGNGIWVHLSMWWNVRPTSAGEIRDAVWAMVGTGATKGQRSKGTHVAWW